nr:MAG: RNA-dependent RNA polymerase [Heterobasidion parviporum fusarivirus 1]
MLQFFFGFFFQFVLLSLANSNWVLGLATLSMVFGRPEAASYSFGLHEYIPSAVQNFLDLKFYGFLCGLFGIGLNWLSRRTSIRALGTTTTLVILSSVILSLFIIVVDVVWFWVLLSIPLALALAFLVTLGPLFLLLNIQVVYRLFTTAFLCAIGVRDPFVDPGILGLVVRRLVRFGGVRLWHYLQFSDFLFNVGVLVPIQFVTSLVTGLFVPSAWVPSGHTHRYWSRVSWSISFFLFGLFDLEVMVYLAGALFVIVLLWAMWTIKVVFGGEVLGEVLLPSFIAFSAQNVAAAWLIFSDGLIRFIGLVVHRSGVSFEYTSADGTAHKVVDTDTLFLWAMWTIKVVFGGEVLGEVLLPSFIAFSAQNVAAAWLIFSDGLIRFIGLVVHRSGVSFEYTSADGTAHKVVDTDTLFLAPPHVRRDIILGYVTFSGLPRLVAGTFFLSCTLGVTFFLTLQVRLRSRVALLPLALLRCLGFATIPWVITDPVLDIIDGGWAILMESSWPILTTGVEQGYAWIRFLYPLLGWVWLHSTRVPLASVTDTPEKPRLSQLFFTRALTLTRRSTLRLVERLNQVRLPEFISNVYEPPTIESITRAYQMLEDVGFPVNQTFLEEMLAGGNDPDHSSYLSEHGSWKKWFLGATSLKLGYNKLQVRTHSWLPESFYEMFPGYLHVASWNAEEPEIKSTSRYWTSNETQKLPGGPVELEDDLWAAVKAQYANSRLATFEEVYKNWVKRYNMGFGFLKEVNGKAKQLTRAEVIQAMGGKWKFLEAWERVFNRGLGLHMPAPVFAKYESLKQKKALEKIVRTIVGSPFVHHVMTTVFNYHPNHNYKVWETPMKVGMPINGQNYNRLWESLLRHDKVWAGDMTAFDSQVSPAIIRVVAAIRKMGYDTHRDRNKICELIDVSYEALIQQPMGFKNLGDIAWKGQGFTTGHSSTSPDNSLALVANYLFAWRRVTGLRAREFFNYNTLANFGDDHVLGYDPVFGWCPERMVAAMRELGTLMRDEAPGEHKMPQVGTDFNNLAFSFLAKQPVPLDGKVLAELRAAGVTVPLTYATAHVKSRLLGKAKGEVLAAKAKDSVRSYTALNSYIYMCAHHHDVYLSLVHEARNMYQSHEKVWERAGLIHRASGKDRLPVPPSYNKVLRTWYAKEPFPYTEEDVVDQDSEDAVFYIHLQDDVLAATIRWLADVPTMLSPRYINTRWADWIQVKLAWCLNWPLSFVSMANQVEQDPKALKILLQKTPYAFLRNEALVPQLAPSFGVLHTRHLLYVGLTRFLGTKRSFSVLDLVRLADVAWGNLVFIFTGQVTSVAIELDLHVVDTLIIVLLSFVSIDSGFTPLQIDMLSPSLLFARFLSSGLRLLMPSGAIDYQPLDEQVRHLMMTADASFTMEAPTGTGKSTRMMMRISSMLPTSMRLIVIEPRHLVCVGVGTYMKALYPEASIGIQTEGHTLDGSERLIYTTVQSFFLNASLRNCTHDVVVLDEAHLDEPSYIVMREWARRNVSVRRVLVTATIVDEIRELGLDHLAVPAINQNKVVRVDHQTRNMSSYVRFVTTFANDRLSVEKILIFVPSIAAAEEISRQVVHRSCVLSSRTPDVDPDASVFISTSVSDAGLTLPDVAFVFSLDYDVNVTVPDKDFAAEVHALSKANDDKLDALGVSPFDPRRANFRSETMARLSRVGASSRPYFYKLSDATLLQRQGRTGRTLDGFFHLFHTTDVLFEEVRYSLCDFAAGLSPASRWAGVYFPKGPVAHVPLFLPWLKVWDTVGGASFTRFVAWRREFMKTIDDAYTGPGTPRYTTRGFQVYLQENMERIRAFGAKAAAQELQADEAPIFVSGVQPGDDDEIVIPEVAPNPLAPDPIEGGGWTPTGLMRRRDVSGAGLLCGVRALLGVVWSLTDHRPTFDEVYASVIHHTAEDVVADPYRNFHALPLQFAGWHQYGVPIEIQFDDGSSTIPPNPEWLFPAEAQLGIIYQGPNHYNYYGYAIPRRVFS